MFGQRVYLSAFAISLVFALGAVAVQRPAAATPESVFLVPFPSECEAAWKQMKINIEAGTGAKVSFTRFDHQAPQYPNLAGFIAIAGVDKLERSDLDPYLNAVFATLTLDAHQFV